MLSVTPKGPRKTNLGRALLHLFGWYAAVVFAFVALAYALPNTGDPDCQDTSCSSLREGVLLAGLFYGGPALLVALLVSLLTLGLIIARRPQSPAHRVGFVSALPAFLVLAAGICVVLR
ncbi:hypothetical protein ACGFIK_19745 [Micromonospora sp. NPDC048871]|uniref:hypothetical protein n=1 Tax=unclassified Micromonospora TaxID=2617518 RepID=UPI002E0F8C75|nr:hypothetical protein OIE53_26400 [Micromonospora sp. NBC_01739]